MRGSAVLVLPALALLPLAGSAQLFPGPAPDTTSVTVTATAEILVPATRAVVYMEVAREAADPAAAARAASDGQAAVLRALEELAPALGGVTPAGYAAGAARDMRTGRSPAAPGAAQAKAALRVVVDSLDLLGRVVATAMEAGASSVLAVTFEAEASDAVRERVVREAVRKARLDAGIMAAAEGGELGPLIRLSTGPELSTIAVQQQLFSGGWLGQGVNVVPARVGVKASVQASWIFLPG